MRAPRLTERPASQERSRTFMVGLGLFGIGLAIAIVLVGFNAPNAIPGRSYYTLYAQFRHADNLTGHYQVRVDGKLEGQVLDPHVEHGVAVAELQFDPSVSPLRSDTTAIVRPRSAVGVRYVEVTPGAHGRPLPNGATIPASQTGATETLDEALSTFDPATRLHTQQFLQGFGKGLAGRGLDLNTTIQQAPSFLTGATSVLGTVAAHPGTVRSLIDGSATISQASDPVRDTIATGFRPEAQALHPFSDQSGVRGTLAEAPPTLATATSDLPAVDGLTAQIAGFAENIRPGLQVAPHALGETAALLRESRPELVSAKAVLDRLQSAVNPTLRLLHTVDPVLRPIDTAVRSATPLVGQLGQHACDITNFGKNWTSMQQYGDSFGSVLRFNVVSGDVADAYGATSRSKTVFIDGYPQPCIYGKEKLP